MRALDFSSRAAFCAVLLWAPLTAGVHRGWLPAITQLFALAGLLFWTLGMVARRRLEWRRTALDFPLALLIALVLAQLALGNGALSTWALAPPPTDPHLPIPFPSAPVAVGTVSPPETARSFLLFLTYAAVYVLVVNLVRTRQGLDRLVRMLLGVGSLLAFFGLLDYLTGEAWLFRWRDHPYTGRASASFSNPDHFAAWLAMLICIGIGYLLARSRSHPGDLVLRDLWGRREERERLVRRYLSFVGVGVMALALVFTLSRGGALSLLLTLAALLVLVGKRGQARWSLVLVGVVLTVTMSYGAWIGLGPFLERVRHAPYASRWVQALTTLPMIPSFPVLGVGLGAYQDIYLRYQPPELRPGKLYFLAAHDDLLQLVVELGLIGTAICLFTLRRVGRDLLVSHLFGRGVCPVGAGESGGARRNERWSVGIALGALAGVLALLVHSGFDFAARNPANGILGATCLGIATVALHTRFSPGGDRWLATIRAFALGPGRLAPSIAAAVALILSLGLVLVIVRSPLVEQKLEAATGAVAFRKVDEALALAPRNVQALALRARLRLVAAQEIWDSGGTPDGRILPSWEERRDRALSLLDGAARDARAALAQTPTDPYVHETLGWVYGTMAVIDPSPAATRSSASALASLHRAIALQPENPFLYRSLAALALAQRPPLLDVALEAARGAVTREADLLADLVERFLPAGPSEAEWLRLVPPSALDRLQLALLLERRGLPREAGSVYRQAIDVAPPDTEPLARWLLAQLLLRQRDPRGATAELAAALKRDPDNPELHLARARALARLDDPSALDAYRAAILKSEARTAEPAADPLPFQTTAPRARAIVVEALGPGERGRAVTYHRALAEYLIDRKLWAQALTECTLVLAGAPQDAAAYFASGRALTGLGEKDRAVEAHRKAVSLDGRSVAFRLALAQSLWDTDQYYQAINEWRAVIGLEPGNIEAHLAVAHAYVRTGERVAAFGEYQHVLRMVPDQPEARRGLSRLGSLPGGSR